MEDLSVSMEDFPVSMEEKKTLGQNPLCHCQSGIRRSVSFSVVETSKLCYANICSGNTKTLLCKQNITEERQILSLLSKILSDFVCFDSQISCLESRNHLHNVITPHQNQAVFQGSLHVFTAMFWFAQQMFAQQCFGASTGVKGNTSTKATLAVAVGRLSERKIGSLLYS